jgi:hypothetical protein
MKGALCIGICEPGVVQHCRAFTYMMEYPTEIEQATHNHLPQALFATGHSLANAIVRLYDGGGQDLLDTDAFWNLVFR